MAFTSICSIVKLLPRLWSYLVTLQCETAEFVTMFGKFFDTSGVNKRKVFQQPYRSGNDFCLKVSPY